MPQFRSRGKGRHRQVYPISARSGRRRKMTVASVVTTPPNQLLIHKNKYSNTQLEYHGKIGKTTELWVDPHATDHEKKSVVTAFKRLPPTAQQQVSDLEIISNPGETIKIGGVEYGISGAHWDKSTGAIRVFTPSEDWDKSEGTIAHEGGHALYDKLTQERRQEEYPHESAYQIHERVKELRVKKYDAIQAKYDPKMETLWKQITDNTEKQMNSWNEPLDTTKQNQLKTEEKKLRRKLITLQHQKDKEEDDIAQNYNTSIILERHDARKRPITTKMTKFEQATKQEGGLTPYSSAYVKANETTQYTENFAEGMKLWYSGAGSEHMSNRIAESYPKTYVAFKDLIAKPTEGHAVSLKDSPLGEEWYKQGK